MPRGAQANLLDRQQFIPGFDIENGQIHSADSIHIRDRLKGGQPVILNLQGVDRGLQRRLIDFSSGLCYALGGTMEKAAEQVFLLTPSNVEVSSFSSVSNETTNCRNHWSRVLSD